MVGADCPLIKTAPANTHEIKTDGRFIKRIAFVCPYAQTSMRIDSRHSRFFGCKISSNGGTVDRPPSKDVTTPLLEWGDGNPQALNELIPLVYRELHRLAKRHLRGEPPGNTLQATALVHEAYLKLVDQQRARFGDRVHFFAVTSQIIRRILVTRARHWRATKRGGGKTMIAFDEAVALPNAGDLDLVALDDALESLSQIDPQQGRIVELRFFGGLTLPVAADDRNHLGSFRDTEQVWQAWKKTLEIAEALHVKVVVF
jgi:RNA polymerase sigma factor (TIGR02999 family)